MKRPIKRKIQLKAALAAALIIGVASSATAANVDSVQIGFTNLNSGLCPGRITMKAWAHTDGPGVVNFVIRNSSGNKTGLMPAAAVKGPTGNWLATLTHKFKITTAVDTKYRAEVKGSPKVSNWVPLKEVCLGKAPKTVGTKPPPAKHVSETNQDKDKDEDQPKPTNGGNNPKPTGGSKPVPGTKPIPQTKPIAQCSSKIVKSTRLSALTKKTGIGSAWSAWEIAVAKTLGNNYASSHNAKNRKENCTWQGMFNCTVSANPCRS